MERGVSVKTASVKNLNNSPVKIMVIGRSGHGKSSVINALAGREVAIIGAVKPTTEWTTEYKIKLPEKSIFTLYDARGLFELTSPDGISTH